MVGEEGARTAFKLDEVYRLAGPHSPDLSLPRDVVLQLHYFSGRELLTRRAWAHGPFEYRGGTVTILPDLSRATLQKWAILRPLLMAIKTAGYSYKWGFPSHVIILKGDAVFVLRYPTELQQLFDFLKTQPVMVLDWLAPLPFQLGRRD